VRALAEQCKENTSPSLPSAWCGHPKPPIQRQYRCNKAGIARLKNSFYLQAIRLLNSHHKLVSAQYSALNLVILGLNNFLSNWILDFLTDHPQVVRVGNNTSATLILNTWAPQRCVLSPLLYSLFSHDCMARHDSNTVITFDDNKTAAGLITDIRLDRSETWQCGARKTTSPSM
jgi:hypothetical protein